MKTPSGIQRAIQGLLITAISIFALAPAHAADAPKVTADNYVRAESDFQMKGYIESFNGKLRDELLDRENAAEGAVAVDAAHTGTVTVLGGRELSLLLSTFKGEDRR